MVVLVFNFFFVIVSFLSYFYNFFAVLLTLLNTYSYSKKIKVLVADFVSFQKVIVGFPHSK